MAAFISELLGVEWDEARRLQKHYYRTYGTTLAGLMAAWIAGGVWLARTIKATRHAGLSNYGEARLSKLIDTGKATDAAISPDGKYVAYTTEEGGKQSLWVKQLVGGNSVQVIAPADVRYTGMTFSPDVNYIYYVSYEKQDNVRRLFRIPILGVTPRKILDDVDTPVSFSPDGRQITFVRG